MNIQKKGYKKKQQKNQTCVSENFQFNKNDGKAQKKNGIIY